MTRSRSASHTRTAGGRSVGRPPNARIPRSFSPAAPGHKRTRAPANRAPANGAKQTGPKQTGPSAPAPKANWPGGGLSQRRLGGDGTFRARGVLQREVAGGEVTGAGERPQRRL